MKQIVRGLVRKGFVSFAVLAVISVSLFGSPAAAQEIEVIVSPGESIQAAIDAAEPGTTIIVLPGRYLENISISTDGIHLIGHGATIIRPPNPVGNNCVPPGAPPGEAIAAICIAPAGLTPDVSPLDVTPVVGVTVEGFRVINRDFDAISAISTQELTVTLNKIFASGCDGIFIIFSSDFLVSRNRVRGAGCAGINAVLSEGGEVVGNKVTATAEGAGINIADASGVKIRANTTRRNCMGISVTDFPDEGAGVQETDFPTTGIVITRNKANGNNRTCGFGFETIGGVGILVSGATDVLVKSNSANRNVVEGSSLTATGIGVGDFPADPPMVGDGIVVVRNEAIGNRSADGPLDLRVEPSGGSIRVGANTCRVSQPNANWC